MVYSSYKDVQTNHFYNYSVHWCQNKSIEFSYVANRAQSCGMLKYKLNEWINDFPNRVLTKTKRTTWTGEIESCPTFYLTENGEISGCLGIDYVLYYNNTRGKKCTQ